MTKLSSPDLKALHFEASLALAVIPNVTVGQVYVNALHKVHPALAESLVGTKANPWSDDRKLADFFLAISE